MLRRIVNATCWGEQKVKLCVQPNGRSWAGRNAEKATRWLDRVALCLAELDRDESIPNLVREAESCQRLLQQPGEDAMATPKKTIYRDSGNGQIISKPTFDRRPPNTVEKERVPAK